MHGFVFPCASRQLPDLELLRTFRCGWHPHPLSYSPSPSRVWRAVPSKFMALTCRLHFVRFLPLWTHVLVVLDFVHSAGRHVFQPLAGCSSGQSSVQLGSEFQIGPGTIAERSLQDWWPSPNEALSHPFLSLPKVSIHNLLLGAVPKIPPLDGRQPSDVPRLLQIYCRFFFDPKDLRNRESSQVCYSNSHLQLVPCTMLPLSSRHKFFNAGACIAQIRYLRGL